MSTPATVERDPPSNRTAEPAAPPITGLDLLRLGAWFGMSAGLLESLAMVLRWRLDGQQLNGGLYLTWMPAGGNLVVFLPVALVLLGLRQAWPRSWPRLITPRSASAVFAGLALLAALQPFVGLLGNLAVTLLVLGVGVQASRVLGARWPGFRRFLRPAVPALLGLLLVMAIGIEGRYRWLERRALAALPTAPAGTPNVLLLILDTVRAENLSVYGYRLPTTPGLVRLAQDGVRFGRAYSTAPWTLPSHASVMTGRWSHEVSGNWHTPLDGRDSTLAEVLAARGYRTGGMVANLGYTSRWTGLDRGFAHYKAHLVTFPQVLRSAGLGARLSEAKLLAGILPPGHGAIVNKPAREVSDELLRWLDRTGDRPFFAFLNFMDAHEPYLPQPPFDTAFADLEYPPLPPPVHPGGHGSTRPRAILPYDQAIAYIDAEISRLASELERRGLWENTLVIVTADHGEEFGEHGVYGHGHDLYLPALGVPLILRLPGRVPAEVVVGTRVSLRDLAATVLDLVAPGSPAVFPGRSLARYWQAGSSEEAEDTLLVGTRWAENRPRWDPTSRGDLQGVITSDLGFIRDVDLAGELYDLASDSTQRRNLATESAWKPAADSLQAFLTRTAGLPARAPP
jgi:arylsulfatase A-like enzyme